MPNSLMFIKVLMELYSCMTSQNNGKNVIRGLDKQEFLVLSDHRRTG